jgi:neutral ceramidase
LASRQTELSLSVRKPTQEEAVLAKQLVQEVPPGQQLVSLPQIYAGETLLLADYPDKVSLILQTFRIGDLGIAAIPCEVFVETGLQIKAESPLKPTFTMELANGYNGYLPTPEQHQLGGYETWRAKSSYLEVDASTKITKEILGLIGTLAGQAN